MGGRFPSQERPFPHSQIRRKVGASSCEIGYFPVKVGLIVRKNSDLPAKVGITCLRWAGFVRCVRAVFYLRG